MNARHPVYTARALRDLRAIGRWIAAEAGRGRADGMLDRIMATAGLLAEHPQLGRERPEIARGLRSFAVWPYVIFYRPLDEGARIMRVLHGHRDMERTLGGSQDGEH